MYHKVIKKLWNKRRPNSCLGCSSMKHQRGRIYCNRNLAKEVDLNNKDTLKNISKLLVENSCTHNDSYIYDEEVGK